MTAKGGLGVMTGRLGEADYVFSGSAQRPCGLPLKNALAESIATLRISASSKCQAGKRLENMLRWK
jgi:hypothetical protein